MKTYNSISIVLTASLLLLKAVHALPTDSTGSGATFGAVSGLALKSETITTGTESQMALAATDNQANAVRCPNGTMMTGSSIAAGNYQTHTMTKNVHIYGFKPEGYDNYSVSLMVTGGTRTIYCRPASLGYS